MSNYRTRAAEVKAAGEAARGDFEPTGVPLRMYQWWLANSPGKKARDIREGSRRENFCHFWRVVVFWTPLLALVIAITGVFESLIEKMEGRGGYVAGTILAVGAAIGIWLLSSEGLWLDFLGFMGVSVGIILVCGAVVIGGAWLSKKYSWFIPGLLITALAGFAAFLLFIGFQSVGAVLFAYVAAVIVGLGVVGFSIFKIGERIQAKRELRKQKAREARAAALNAYYNGDGPDPRRPVRVPSAFERKIVAFFSGLGDFFVLATQVVRVNKWKICPLVTVDTRENV